jgi:hypothetical protein
MQALKYWIKRNFAGWIYGRKKNPARKRKMIAWLQQFNTRPAASLSDASFDIFTYHGEDGIISYLLQQLSNVPSIFVDIGAGNCIIGNCAALAQHFSWSGVFIDKDDKQLSTGKGFYKEQIASGTNFRFIAATVTMENVNALIKGSGVSENIGILSIDIDGNDYWVWKAIDVIQPRIVVIEAKVEFGYYDAIVPYSAGNHRSVDKMYNGASVEAFRKLGEAKGYKLVGANKYGYNLFFVKENENIPAVTAAGVLKYPGTIKSFYPETFFKEHKFVKV